MSYQLINKLQQFSFQHGSMLSCKWNDTNLYMEIDGAVANDNNDYNNRSVNTYISTLSLQFFEAKVEELLLEGYKYYDANNVLLDEVPDKTIDPEKLDEIMRLCESGYIANAKILESKNQRFFQQFQIDAVDSNDTYCFTISFKKSVASWERFMQKAEIFLS